MKKITQAFLLASCVTLHAESSTAAETAIAISSDCIITKGAHQTQNSLFGLPLTKLTKKKKSQDDGEKGLTGVPAAIAVELFDKAIEQFVSLGKAYIKKRANPEINTFKATVPTTLFAVSSEVEADKVVYETSLRKDLQCITFMTRIRGVYRTGSGIATDAVTSEWQDAWNETGPDIENVKSRLETAGFVFTNSPSIIFEARWELSQDGTAARLIPVYLRALNYRKNDKSLKTEYGERNLAFSVSITQPATVDGAEAIVLAQAFNAGLVETGKARGPKELLKESANVGWTELKINKPELSDITKIAVQENEDSFLLEGFYPVNVNVELSVAKEPKEIFVFLNSIFEEVEIDDGLSAELRAGLGLLTDEERKEKEGEKTEAYHNLSKTIAKLEAAQTLLQAEKPIKPTKPENGDDEVAYDGKLMAYQDALDAYTKDLKDFNIRAQLLSAQIIAKKAERFEEEHDCEYVSATECT